MRRGVTTAAQRATASAKAEAAMTDGDKDAVREAFAERSKLDSTAAQIAVDQAALECELHDLVEGASASLVELRRLNRPLPPDSQQADIAKALLFVRTFPRPQNVAPPAGSSKRPPSPPPPPPAPPSPPPAPAPAPYSPPAPAPAPYSPPAPATAPYSPIADLSAAGTGSPGASTNSGRSSGSAYSGFNTNDRYFSSGAAVSSSSSPRLPAGVVSVQHALTALRGKKVALGPPPPISGCLRRKRALRGCWARTRRLSPSLATTSSSRWKASRASMWRYAPQSASTSALTLTAAWRRTLRSEVCGRPSCCCRWQPAGRLALAPWCCAPRTRDAFSR